MSRSGIKRLLTTPRSIRPDHRGTIHTRFLSHTHIYICIIYISIINILIKDVFYPKIRDNHVLYQLDIILDHLGSTARGDHAGGAQQAALAGREESGKMRQDVVRCD